MKRYVVQVEKYVWAENDKEVIDIMEQECAKQDLKFDNRCSVVKIVEQKFGSIGSREVL